MMIRMALDGDDVANINSGPRRLSGRNEYFQLFAYILHHYDAK